MVLIERNEIYKRFFNGGHGIARIHVSDIDVIPTIDAAPVVHGRWIYNTERNKWVCDKCNASAMPSRVQFEQYNTKFCPNCGARMGGGD